MGRVIRKSHNNSQEEVLDLLRAVFAAELVVPSTCLWLVSPWISDVELLDNTAGTYSGLARFGQRPIRLTEILVALAVQGTTIVIGTTADSHNRNFRGRLEQQQRDYRIPPDRVVVRVDSTGQLHAKAVTGDDYALTGSMNITYNGIRIREEYVELRTESDFVARARMDSFDRFGGAL